AARTPPTGRRTPRRPRSSARTAARTTRGRAGRPRCGATSRLEARRRLLWILDACVRGRSGASELVDDLLAIEAAPAEIRAKRSAQLGVDEAPVEQILQTRAGAHVEIVRQCGEAIRGVDFADMPDPRENKRRRHEEPRRK